MVATKRGLCILAIGLATVAAGCGSRETSRSGARTPTTTPSVQATIAACKQRIKASALSAALKEELKKSCAQEASGDGMTSPAQKTRREVCRKIVIQRTPPGPARQRGLAACAVNSRYP